MEKRRHDFSGHYNLLHPPFIRRPRPPGLSLAYGANRRALLTNHVNRSEAAVFQEVHVTSFDRLSILPSIPACHPGILSTNQTPRSNYLSQLRGPDCLPASLTKAFSSSKRSAFWAMSRYLPALLVSPLADSKRPASISTLPK